MIVTTVSFVVGKGSISHNNRSFVAENVIEERIVMDEFFVQEPLEKAYDKAFGQAIEEYNASQSRKDRQIGGYITKIKNSKNNEKVFYENVVQVGKMTDFGVCDENGNITENAMKAKEVLENYVKTFQERNPNLYLFNAVLHMDEATPHLHLDYFPVAHGYKTGMKTRNSLTKALQEMGIEKATSRNDNETMHWQERERGYISELCAEVGIEVEVLGVERDDYTIPEYKAAMKAKDEAEAELEILKAEKAEVMQVLQDTSAKAIMATEDVEELERKRKEIEEKTRAAEKEYSDNERRISDLVDDEKKIAGELSKIRNQAVDVPNIFGGEPMVKLPKKSFERLMSICRPIGTLSKVIKRMEAELGTAKDVITNLKVNEKSLTEKVASYDGFLREKGLREAFLEFLNPKSLIAQLRADRERMSKEPVPNKVVKKKRDVCR